MLICRMFSGLYFENAEHINFIPRSLIVVFSFLTARLNRVYEDRISETIGYFKKKTNTTVSLKKKPNRLL